MSNDWQSNILIATVGTAPSVVTETVWALLRRKPEPWVPTAIFLLATTKGEAACERHLRRADGELAALFAYRGLPFVVPDLVVPKLPDKSKIDDIRTKDDNIAFANEITRLIKEHAERPDSRVHVSIAGGRKTMSSYAQAAISVFGRDQDELTHVLVSIPEFEYNSKFFYPEQKEQEIEITVGDQKVKRLAREAKIELVPSHFIRLGYILKEDAFPGGEVSYERVVEQVQAGLEVNQIKLLCASNEVIIGRSTRVRLPARAFAFYRLLAVARKEGWPGCGPEGFGPEQRGWLSYGRLTLAAVSDKSPLELFCGYYVESAAASERDDAFNDRVVTAKKSVKELRSWAATGEYDRIRQRFRDIKNDLGGAIVRGVANVTKREFANVREKQDKRAETELLRDGEIAYFGLRPEADQITIAQDSSTL
jgi:CRISPR-associated protein (TIGR02584 family)